MRTRRIEPLPRTVLEDIGMHWHTDPDGSPYLVPELVEVSEREAEAFYEAANGLYALFVEAAQHVIDHRRYAELGIDPGLVPLIEASWERDDWHLYGRFDLAGGLDGAPVKLIEFNADTPTALYETAIVQWAQLRANGLDEARQFNNLHEMLQQSFRCCVVGEDGDFARDYRQEKFLFSSIEGLPEDERTVRYLQHVAHEAGLYTDFCYLHEAGFLDGQGVFNRDAQRADYWFRLFPWEDIPAEELELVPLLQGIDRVGATRILNPAYTVLFQSKGLLAILYELFPDAPWLLETRFEPLAGKAQVEKRLFGREGANTRILDRHGAPLAETGGDYGHHPAVYQEYIELPRDAAGHHYQAGVFHACEACGLGFRRGGLILDNGSQFVGHVIV